MAGTVHDITERKAAEGALHEVSGRILHVQDEERRRLARELHDSTGQNLAGLSMKLKAVELEAMSLSDAARQALTEAMALSQDLSQEIRSVSYLLHPPFLDESGLISAIRWFAEGFPQRTGIQVYLDLPGDMDRLPRDLETTLFRVIQESLTNVWKHSASPTVTIRLERTSTDVKLFVKDVGRGFAQGLLPVSLHLSKLGVGIMGMMERVRQFRGNLKIDSGSWGTTVEVTLPVSKDGQ
jgi:signal transduction histidine kinase